MSDCGHENHGKPGLNCGCIPSTKASLAAPAEPRTTVDFLRALREHALEQRFRGRMVHISAEMLLRVVDDALGLALLNHGVPPIDEELLPLAPEIGIEGIATARQLDQWSTSVIRGKSPSDFDLAIARGVDLLGQEYANLKARLGHPGKGITDEALEALQREHRECVDVRPEKNQPCPAARAFAELATRRALCTCGNRERN